MKLDDDKHLGELLDRVFDIMDGENNLAFVAVARTILASALDCAPPEIRNEAGNRILKIVEDLVASRRIH